MLQDFSAVYLIIWRLVFQRTIFSHEWETNTLPETNKSHLKIGFPKRKGSSSSHQFLGARAVSFREGTSWRSAAAITDFQ